MPAPLEIKPGDTFGKWRVLSRNETETRPGRFYWVECSCEAKTVRSVAGVALRNGKSRACGCETRPALVAAAKARGVGDLTGRVFDLLTVLGLAGGSQRRERRWKCQCACVEGGVGFVIKNESTLLRGREEMSCGCLAKQKQAWHFALDRHEKKIAAGPPDHTWDCDMIEAWYYDRPTEYEPRKEAA